jgi:hypothetical protein
VTPVPVALVPLTPGPELVFAPLTHALDVAQVTVLATTASAATAAAGWVAATIAPATLKAARLAAGILMILNRRSVPNVVFSWAQRPGRRGRQERTRSAHRPVRATFHASIMPANRHKTVL